MSHALRIRPLAGLALSGFLLGSALLVGPTGSAAAAPPDGRSLPPDVAAGAGAPPLPSGLSSESWLVADLTSGQVLAAKAGSAQRAPASTLKILTALTFLDQVPPEIEVQPSDVAVDGRRLGLKPGVRYRSDELLNALFVGSGNDVAQALARAGGGGDAGPDRMTQVAAGLGATDTTAGSVTGLDADGQLTTAYDLAVLSRAALARPDIRRAAALTTATVTGSDGARRSVSSSNPLLGHYAGAIGLKTGSSADAGNTFVGAAERDGHTLAVVLMQAPSSYGTEASALLDWGFRAVGSTAPLAVMPPLGAPAAPADAGAGQSDPPPVPLAENGGGISPRLALALALTIIASAFTYWQGRERVARRPIGTGRRATAAQVSDDEPDPAVAGERDRLLQEPQSVRDSRKIFAP